VNEYNQTIVLKPKQGCEILQKEMDVKEIRVTIKGEEKVGG